MTKHSYADCPLNGRTGSRKILDDSISKLLTELSIWAHAASLDNDTVEVETAKQLSGALAGRAPREHMPIVCWHDAIDRHNAIEIILKAVNLPTNFGCCTDCE